MTNTETTTDPRPEPAPETWADRGAWWSATIRGQRRVWGPGSAAEIQRQYLLADRRDALIFYFLGLCLKYDPDDRHSIYAWLGGAR